MDKTARKRPAPQRRPAKGKRRRRRASPVHRFFRRMGVALLVLALIVLAALAAVKLLEEKPQAMRYPMEYLSIIRENAAEQGLEPEYVSAVILAESSYNPNAVSAVNAQGLMQIMPDTGAWIAGKFDEEYAEGCLFDPETNIRYGCWYLGWLLRRYDGDKVCATAAYHSGHGKVDRWLANPAYSADGRNLISMEESNASIYVDKVMRYYEKYLEIYAGDAA